jgi:hypothetical protein
MVPLPPLQLTVLPPQLLQLTVLPPQLLQLQLPQKLL